MKLEWLEDSLLGKSRRPLDPSKYEYEQVKIRPKKRVRVAKKNDDISHTHEASEEGEIEEGVSSRQEEFHGVNRKRKGAPSIETGRMTKSQKLEISGMCSQVAT